jgi:hypothetical protein
MEQRNTLYFDEITDVRARCKECGCEILIELEQHNNPNIGLGHCPNAECNNLGRSKDLERVKAFLKLVDLVVSENTLEMGFDVGFGFIPTFLPD